MALSLFLPLTRYCREVLRWPAFLKTSFERLKREVSLVRLVEAKGVKLSKRGSDLIGLCPFHEDHDPSLVVTPSKNLWHCLGACHQGGSVIDWVMKAEGISFRHAVELLREGLPLSKPAAAVPIKVSTVKKLPVPFDADIDDAELLRQVVGFYHETLKQSPEALQYLESRALHNAEMIERFKLGFANRTLGVPPAGEEPKGRGRDPGPVAAARGLAGERARALQRVDSDPCF